MKQILIFLILLFPAFLARAQPCHEVDLRKDSLENRIMYDYILDCYREHYFKRTKSIGIVSLTQYTDEQDRKVWRLAALIDDSYKDYPTTKYDIFGSDVVLIYDADSTGKQIFTPPTPALLECLDEIIGSRVYIRPHEQDRWIEKEKLINNKWVDVKEKIKWNIASAGYSPSTIIITFHKDGTFKKEQGV